MPSRALRVISRLVGSDIIPAAGQPCRRDLVVNSSAVQSAAGSADIERKPVTAEVRLAVDVGGTFTDVVLLLSDGTAIPRKLSSSPPRFDIAVKAGIAGILAETGLPGEAVREDAPGTTVATQCLLTRSRPRTGLVTTTGFRGGRESGRMRVHKRYELHRE